METKEINLIKLLDLIKLGESILIQDFRIHSLYPLLELMKKEETPNKIPHKDNKNLQKIKMISS